MNRKQTLDAAMQCVTSDRQATHGRPENTFTAIARLWSTYLDMRGPVVYHGVSRNITSVDVCAMLALLKVGRITQNPCHEDNWVDLAGYAACGAELAQDMQTDAEMER